MKKYIFKICVFGDVNVGKTTLLNYLKHGRYEDVRLQQGVDFYDKTSLIEGDFVTLHYWDYKKPSEHERMYHEIYYRGVYGGIFVFDLTNEVSLNNLNLWHKVFSERASNTEINIPILMIGNKADLEEKRVISHDKALEITKFYNLYGYYECSTKTGQNVEEALVALGPEILNRVRK